MKVLRRLDDAVCALATGHSRRDLDRVRRRRLVVLGRRVVRRETKLAAEEDGPLAELIAESRLSKAGAFHDLVERLLQGVDRVAAARLAKKLDIDRASLFFRRCDEFRNRCLFDRPDHAVDDSSKPLPIESVELYGKLYEGLEVERLRDFGLRRLGLWVRDWQGKLRRFEQHLNSVATQRAGAGDHA